MQKRRDLLCALPGLLWACDSASPSSVREPAKSGRSVAASAGLTPVVIELFSSEGCSSCPSADALLGRLVDEQPVAGVHIVGLELHVDYWDDLGWKDPFSNASFTARQKTYSQRAGHRSVFTPEAVIAGTYSALGSDREDVLGAVDRARSGEHLRLELARHSDRGMVVVRVPSTPARRTRIELVVAERGLVSKPSRGENAGTELKHAPVVRFLNEISERALAGEIVGRIPPHLAERADRLDIVALARDDESLAIVGAGILT